MAAHLDLDHPPLEAIPLALGSNGELAWALPRSEGAVLYRRDPDGVISEAELPVLPDALSFAAFGSLYWAGHDGAQVLVGSFDQPETQTIAGLEQVSRLALCADVAGGALVVAASATLEGGDTLWLYSDIEEAPLRIIEGGREPRLACGDDGAVHLAWRQGDALGYASNADWTQTALIAAPGLMAWDMDHDEAGHAYLAWATSEGFWVANAYDWQRRQQMDDAGLQAGGLALAVSASGALHRLWWGAEQDDVQAAFVAQESHAHAQLRVVAVGQQATLTPDTRFVAVSNLAPAEIEAVQYYLVARSGLTLGDWRWFATDTDGGDGFAAQAPATMVQPGEEYAVAALARLADGRSLVAQSDWLRAESGWPAILAAPEASVWRGVADVRLLPLTERERDGLYELWLQPSEEGLARSEPVYLGAQVLPASAPAREWFSWPVDARLAPDGRYALYATITTDEGSARLTASGEVAIDNACPPQIQAVSVELSGRMQDTLRVQVDATDVNGTVERVDMFLLPRSGLDKEADVAPVWLGSDDSATGGWGLDIALRPEWRGSEWAVQAVAYDNDDLPSAQAVSPFIYVPSQGLQLRFVRPDAGRLVTGDQTVTLIIDEGVTQVERVAFYVEDAAGAAHHVGAGRLNVRLVTAEIDTRQLPDGYYRLLAHAHADGATSVWPGPEIEVANSRPWVELDRPPQGSLYGQVRHAIHIQRAAASIVSATFVLRDEQSTVTVLGFDDTPVDGFEVVWDARHFIAGDYVLGCTLADSLGNESYHEWPLTIGSRWAIDGPLLSERLTGVARLAWEARGLPDGAMLTLEYSPDAGVHWLGVSELAAADGAGDIDTAQLPDSRDARFRLVWAGGPARVVGVSSPVVVDNRNDPPHLAVLTPQPGEGLPSQALIAWEASDPDGDTLSIDIAARQAEGAWVAVASRLADTGRYEWDTTAFQGGAGWELRVVARDSRGATREAFVDELTLTHNRAPTVRLVWPNAEVALDGETVVLWSAFDLDGDTVLIDLYYSDNAGQAWYTLAEGLPNTGYYSWETAFVPPGAAYRLRVVARDGQLLRRAQSSGLSTIGGAALTEVRLALPRQDASLRRVAAVCWSTLHSGGVLASISVEARERRTGAVEPVITGAPLTGCTLWDTLYVPDGPYDLVVSGHDADGAARIRSTTPVQVQNLALYAPRAQWIEPLPFGWQAGPVSLRWGAWDPDGDAMVAEVQVSQDEGLTWDVVGQQAATLGAFVWEAGPHSQTALVRLAVEDARGSRSFLGPLRISKASLEAVPEITLSLARVESTRVARWLAQDAGNRDLEVSLVRLYADGEAELLIEGQPEVGEALLPTLQQRQAAAVCARADNGVVTRLVCEAVAPPTGWTVRPVQPAIGQELAQRVAVQWEVMVAADAPQPEAQQLLWSRDGRQTWVLLDELAPDARRYDWDLTDLAGGDYWLRVEIQGEGRSVATEWGPFGTAMARPLVGITLAGLHPGQSISGAWTLHWLSWGAPSEARVNLSYRTAPNAPWRSLARGLLPDGQFVWDTAALANGSRIWLRAELEAPGGPVYHAPATPFTMASGQLPTLRLEVKDQGICWQSWGVSASAGVRLLFSPDGGANWTTLDDGLPASGCWQQDQALHGAWPLLRAVVTDDGRQGVDTVSLANWR